MEESENERMKNDSNHLLLAYISGSSILHRLCVDKSGSTDSKVFQTDPVRLLVPSPQIALIAGLGSVTWTLCEASGGNNLEAKDRHAEEVLTGV